MTAIDLENQLETQFAGCRIGGQEFLPLYRKAIAATKTEVPDWKVSRRALRAFFLAQYFQRSLSVPGHFVECGVFNGFSSYLLRWLMEGSQDETKEFHLVDSFEGLSELKKEDQVIVDGSLRENLNKQGHFSVSFDLVYGRFSGFEQIYWHKGWIPAVLGELPERAWAFAHLDVDLYEPTKACLEYVLPRMSAGGIIVNDDFGSPDFPGAGLAWREVMEARNLPYIALDSGQAIYIHGD